MVRQDAEIPNKNPLKTLHDEGQTVWLDFLSRTFLADDGLKRLIERDGLTGVTSNPSIFEKAMRNANVGSEKHIVDAETAPLIDPQAYRYELDVADIAELWRRGSVISSWLLDLIADALFHDPELSEFEGHVSDSGEGRWTLKAAIDEGVPASALSSALYGRFTSRGAADFADKLLSAMRHEFGGHTELSPNKKVAAHR